MSDLKVLITREEIAKRVAELGAEITRDFKGEPVMLVGVLKGAAIFLASEAASFVTGEIIAVDGGFLASGVNQ